MNENQQYLAAINLADRVLDRYEERRDLSPLQRQDLKGYIIAEVFAELKLQATANSVPKDSEGGANQ